VLWLVAFYLIGFASLPAYWVLRMLADEPPADAAPDRRGLTRPGRGSSGFL
jgi:hypothetical protein